MLNGCLTKLFPNKIDKATYFVKHHIEIQMHVCYVKLCTVFIFISTFKFDAFHNKNVAL